ncbi:iron-sulfur cluster repair protein YtfE (RIC family) [Hamadaea flava]|uniref:Hemerythrin domain-containing protein n=1 Tax=Hamadaea flava TaxID=1742688 RepID=A0ABV8LMC8_9ACTN|nr:hemerythrin domain-containing protein [Hamadaea flava]MCP2323220.1 iron-sulfur cluster repair protein YtfE (RIC family) [Hamadaea flava]
MDGIVLLKEDHKAVKRLFREYERIHEDASPAQKRALVDKIIHELTTHAFIEETIFYPAARAEVPGNDEHVLESVEEHHVVAWLLAELAKLDPADETFDAKVTVLIENVEHHVEEEEQEWFPEVRKTLGRNRLSELGEQMSAAKAKAPADPLALMSAKA